MKGFAAFPSSPKEISTTFSTAIEILHNEKIFQIQSWMENDIAGRFLVEPILSHIDESDILFADITKLNFNVTYEIGYAIGKKKRVILVCNTSLLREGDLLKEVGIYDTIGYKEYENSQSLAKIFRAASSKNPIEFGGKAKKRTPAYIILPESRTDSEIYLLSKLKKTKLGFKSFDPQERKRMPPFEAIDNVANSAGVIVSLVPKHRIHAIPDNMRCAFVAGLAHGMGRILLMLQEGDDPVPLDYRDLVSSYTHPRQVDEYIHNFASDVVEQLQTESKPNSSPTTSRLATLNVGSVAAENEFRELTHYYIETDEYHRVLRGEAQIIAARKGSGKTALFMQVRDKLRTNRKNIILDLRPEGFQLVKLKETFLDYLEEGSKEHLITVLWEYLLLLEICHKILEDDKLIHRNDHRLRPLYLALSNAYEKDIFVDEGDFSERMVQLLNHIQQEFSQIKKEATFPLRLSTDQITEIVYQHDIGKLRKELSEYLTFKEQVWILFDNLDKGWPSHGLGPTDLISLRCLLDAMRKVQKYLTKNEIDTYGTVFIRNDVYEILLDETADRGKMSRLTLDWADPELLREMLRRRIIYSGFEQDMTFADLWSVIAVSHINGEETSQYLIDRCLMRPRALLEIFNHCRSHAVNLGHLKIDEEDIRQGEESFSADLLINIGLEIRDVFPQGEDLLYEFLGSSQKFTEDTAKEILESKVGVEDASRALNILLWHGILGILRDDTSETYIYTVKYDLKRLTTHLGKQENSLWLCINPAFWKALEIKVS